MATRNSLPPLQFDRAIDSDARELMLALRRSEDRFEQLVRRAGYAIYRSTVDGRFLDVNPAMTSMLGYSSEHELYSLDLATDIYWDPRERERLRQRASRGEVDWVETRWRRRDGSPMDVRLSVRAVYDELGRIECYEGIAEDVTERRRTEELLRRSERMACLGATLAGVAHELNNPLTAILGFAQLLLRKELDEESRAALDTIDHEASRAGKIVRELLTLTRKREAERRSRVSINDVLTYIVQTRRYALETRGVACTMELDLARPAVLGDRTQLEQVVLNLLNNAEQAIRSAWEHGGSVRIRTTSDGAHVVIEMEDDGPGIPEHARQSIWNPFWTTKGAGTGLGLAVVNGIIATHGGTIDAQPRTGSGARFIVTLPQMQGSPSDGVAEPAELAQRALDVLVIEPDSQELGFLANFLESRGHAVLGASDLEHAVRLTQRMPFDAVICEASTWANNDGLSAIRASANALLTRYLIAAGGPETTARLAMPLPHGVGVVMRPYDLEELRLLLEG